MEERQSIIITLNAQNVLHIVQLFLLNYSTTSLFPYLENALEGHALLMSPLKTPTVHDIIALHYEVNRKDVEVLSIEKSGTSIKVTGNILSAEQQEIRAVLKQRTKEALKFIKNRRTKRGISIALGYLYDNCGLATLGEVLADQRFIDLRPGEVLNHFNRPEYLGLMNILKKMGVKKEQLPEYYRTINKR